MMRIQFSPTYSQFGLGLTLSLIGLTLGAGVAGAWISCAAMGVMALELILWGLQQCAAARAEILLALSEFVVVEPPAKRVSSHAFAKSLSIPAQTIVARGFTAADPAVARQETNLGSGVDLG
jgi:hypothetical protein